MGLVNEVFAYNGHLGRVRIRQEGDLSGNEDQGAVRDFDCLRIGADSTGCPGRLDRFSCLCRVF